MTWEERASQLKGEPDYIHEQLKSEGYKVTLWMEHRNLGSRDGIDDAICGLMFNIMAYYKKILYDRMEQDNKRGNP